MVSIPELLNGHHPLAGRAGALDGEVLLARFRVYHISGYDYLEAKGGLCEPSRSVPSCGGWAFWR